MKYCKRCVIPNTRPGIKFNKEGVCYPCLTAEKRKETDWDSRLGELVELVKPYRHLDGEYDCIIPASGGKDSYIQSYIMKNILHMNPLIVCVKDSFGDTETGKYNLYNMSQVFGVDVMTYNLNHMTMKKMMRIAFEEFGAPNWPIDLAIYSIPLKIADMLNVPLVIYGENIAYEYGGPGAKETYSAKDQIGNDVVKPIDWNWWYSKGITREEVKMIEYPSKEIVDNLEPIYLSYFYPWDGKRNYELAKRFGFRSLVDEWEREGFIEDYDQLDSVGYLIHPCLKYPKFGHGRATDVACNWIRNGDITREEGIKLVKEEDHKLDQYALDDFIHTLGYTHEEFYDILDGIYNTDLFEKVNGLWEPKFEVK